MLIFQKKKNNLEFHEYRNKSFSLGIEQAVDIIADFAKKNNLEFHEYRNKSFSLGKDGTQVLFSQMEIEKRLCFQGIREHVHLYSAEMFDYTNYGRFNIGTSSGQNRMKKFLQKTLTEYEKKQKIKRTLSSKAYTPTPR